MPPTHPSNLFDGVCLSTTFAQGDALDSALREQEARLGIILPTLAPDVFGPAESGSDTDSDAGMPNMTHGDTDDDSDEDPDEDPFDIRSCATYNIAGGQVVWSSSRQNGIPLSTTQAEVVAATTPRRLPSWVFSALGSFLLAIPLTYAMMPAMQAIARGSVLCRQQPYAPAARCSSSSTICSRNSA